ncbi:MAG: hypothetical protein ABW212_10615 [Pseudonocardia sediminis]
MLPTVDLSGVRPTADERAVTLPGDDLVPDAEVVMDRAFSLAAAPASVWPWIVQLGKGRSGWYLPRRVETVVPPRRRGIRRIDPDLQHLRPGDVIPDWGGPDATFEVVVHEPPHVLVHRSTRGRIRLSWAIVARAEGTGTRMHLRLRMAGIRRRRLAELGGGFFDLLTIAGLAAGLRERVALTG